MKKLEKTDSDKGNFFRDFFVDLQEAFNMREHTLLRKLEHCSVRFVAHDWLKSYLSDRKQFVSITGHDSNLASVLYAVPQGSILGPFLFLVSINYLNQAIKFCEVHRFADETNLLHFSKSITRFNNYLNFDMNNISYWLNANKISLNVQKSELLFFTNTFLFSRTHCRMNLNSIVVSMPRNFFLKIDVISEI